jgi:hypothetical protein
VKRLSEQTLYEILEVPKDAAASAIEAAVERIRALYGPGSLATYTLMSPDEAELLATRVEEARRTLLDPERRASYDASLSPHAEAVRVAAGNGSPVSSAPFAGLPPVIPAVASEPPPPPDEPRAPERPAAKGEGKAKPVALRTAVKGPIRLDREVKPEPEPQPQPPLEIPMPAGSAWTGDALRKVREARGLTVAQVAERTKVTRYHVENIELERYSALPAPVYLRGILLSLARELRLDGQKVSRAYLERAQAAGYGGGPA